MNLFVNSSHSFLDNSINVGADLQKGDVLKTIDGQKAEFFDEFVPLLENYKNQNVSVELEDPVSTKSFNMVSPRS